MKFSSREKLLKEADNELDRIKNKLNKDALSKSTPKLSLDIKSQEDWEKFVKDEELAQLFTKKWRDQISAIANRGGYLNIDLDKLTPTDRYRADYLLSELEREINMAKYGNPYKYGKIFKILHLLLALLGLISVFFMESFSEDNTKFKLNKNKKLLQKLKNPPDPLKIPKNQTLDWVKSVISIIKK